MIESYTVVIAQCDNESPTKECWGELIIKLEEGETVEQAIMFLQTQQWDVKLDVDENDETVVSGCYCPYCAFKVKKNKPKLKLVKGGKQ
jgi:hypothetical protein